MSNLHVWSGFANSRDFVTALIDAVLTGAAGTTNGPPDLDNPGVYKAPTQPIPLPVNS